MAAAQVNTDRRADNANVLRRVSDINGGESFVLHWLFSRSHKINKSHKSHGFYVRSTPQKASANIHEPSFVCSIAWTMQPVTDTNFKNRNYNFGIVIIICKPGQYRPPIADITGI